MAEFNRLQSAITQDVLGRLGEVSDMDLSIPAGTLTGSALKGILPIVDGVVECVVFNGVPGIKIGVAVRHIAHHSDAVGGELLGPL